MHIVYMKIRDSQTAIIGRSSRLSGGQRRGLSLIELTVFLSIVTVGIVATLSLYVNLRITQRLTEERRIASLAAEQKIDEIRIFINNGKTLDQAFQYYGPIPLPNGGPGATFDVPSLRQFTDYDKKDGARPNPRSIGTVSIINDENPNEKLFGYDFNNNCEGPPFGIDVNGNGAETIQTGFYDKGMVGYNDIAPYPFPLDLNGNGSNGSLLNPWESDLVSGFVILPVVVTIQWQGTNGAQRFDLFAIITANRITEVQ